MPDTATAVLPKSTVLTGGQVLTEDGVIRADVRIDASGTVESIGPDLQGDLRLDAADAVVVPGFVDLQVYVGEPGAEHVETVQTASRAAALGGCTAIVATSDTPDPVDSAAAVRELQALTRDALCQIELCGAVTVGRRGEQLAPMGEMSALGVRLFGDNVHLHDPSLLRRICDYAVGLAVTVMVVAEDDLLAGDGQMHEGAVSSELGLAGRPAEAELVGVARDCTIAAMTGATMHFSRISTPGAAQHLVQAKAAGIAVTAHTTPHHLHFTDTDCASFDPTFKVDPPLRSVAMRDGLADLVQAGHLDAVASDHRPCAEHAKQQPFDIAEAGIAGIDTRAGLLAAAMPQLDLGRLVDLLSTGPARIAGLDATQGGTVRIGRPANLAVVEPMKTRKIDRSDSASLGRNTAAHGLELPMVVRHTINRGEPVVRDGAPLR